MSGRVREALQVAEHVARARRTAGHLPGPEAHDFELFWREADAPNLFNSSCSLHIRFRPAPLPVHRRAPDSVTQNR